MGQVREAIIEDRYPRFLMEYLRKLYKEIPRWATTALRGVGVELE